MASHQNNEPDPPVTDDVEPAAEEVAAGASGDVEAPAKRAWYRRPPYLAALVLVAAVLISGLVVVIQRDSGSHSGSSTAAGGAGTNKTIGNYLTEIGVGQTPVRVGEPGTPVIKFPLPPGWSDAGPDTPPGVYGEMLYDHALNPDDVPFIDILLSRLGENADPARILEFAPGELKNLPAYRVVSEPTASQLGGFDAVQLGGFYTKNGEERIIAQKTVVIPSASGLFVLQMNADAPAADAAAVQQATALIDEQATITP